MLETNLLERDNEIGEMKDQITLVKSTNKLKNLLHSDDENFSEEEDDFEDRPRISNPIDLKLLNYQNTNDLEAVCE